LLGLVVLVLLGAPFLAQSHAEVRTETYNLTVEVGQIGQVRLPVNPSTGCSWWVESAPSSVGISTSSDVDPTIDCGNPPRPGCSNEIVVYSFKSNTAGDYTIELRYGHAWARNEYYEIVMVQLTVTGPAAGPLGADPVGGTLMPVNRFDIIMRVWNRFVDWFMCTLLKQC
jgi:predicted secreted protein